jgi:hypothetical protein
MKKQLLLILVIALGLFACKNSNQKEIGEVDSLISIVEETEKALLSVDTSRAYAAKRLVDQDMNLIKSIGDTLNREQAFRMDDYYSGLIKSIGDTLNREQAFRMDDYYSGKKKIFRFSSNYMNYVNQLNLAKKQLLNLKQDLTNGLVSENDYKHHYSVEQAAVMELNSSINKSVGGIDEAITKLEKDRAEMLKIFEELKQNSSENE